MKIFTVIFFYFFLGLLNEASAQISAKSYPEFRSSDRLNVDVTTGLPFWTVPDVSIGPEYSGFRHSVYSLKASFLTPQDNFTSSGMDNVSTNNCTLLTVGEAYFVKWNSAGECFYLQGGVFTSYSRTGNILESEPGGYVYTLSSGTKIKISGGGPRAVGHVSSILNPDGQITTIHYQVSGNFSRIRSVSNNNGFRLYYRYVSENTSDIQWATIVGLTGYNAAYEACDPNQSCTLSAYWPSSTYLQYDDGNFKTTSIVNSAGQSTDFVVDLSYQYGNYGRFNSVKFPTSEFANISYNYCPYSSACTIIKYNGGGGSLNNFTIVDLVLSAKQNGLTWSYGLNSEGPYNLARNSTAPNGDKIIARTTTSGVMNSLQTPEGTFYFDGTSAGHVTGGPLPDGTLASYFRDARGNITHIVIGSNGSTITEQAAQYPVNCINHITCNRPTSLSDANGNQTIYEYDPVHGGVLKATGPTVGGVLKETRYTYEQHYPWYLNASGVPVQDPHPIWVLARESSCRTDAPSGVGCAVNGDELVTVYDYGPTTGLNNLLVRGVVQDAAGLAARTCYGYDRFGNKISETSPNASLTSCP